MDNKCFTVEDLMNDLDWDDKIVFIYESEKNLCWFYDVEDEKEGINFELIDKPVKKHEIAFDNRILKVEIWI